MHFTVLKLVSTVSVFDTTGISVLTSLRVELMKAVNSAFRYISINIEFVATGYCHDDRDLCSVTLVGHNRNVLLSNRIKPEKEIVSYLTPITHVEKGAINNGAHLSSVLPKVKSILGPDVILISQKTHELHALQLEKNVHYIGCVDLTKAFSYYHPYYDNYSIFSLQHQAKILLCHG